MECVSIQMAKKFNDFKFRVRFSDRLKNPPVCFVLGKLLVGKRYSETMNRFAAYVKNNEFGFKLSDVSDVVQEHIYGCDICLRWFAST